MRCLALAQAWQDAGGRAFFASAELPIALSERLTREEMEILPIDAPPGSLADASATVAAAEAAGAVWIVLDGYVFGGDYQQHIKASMRKLFVIDDWGTIGCHSADILLDQNLATVPSAYSNRPTASRLLLGPRYALLRREFCRLRKGRQIARRAHKVLVTLGGSDPHNVTAKVVSALARLSELDLIVKVVIGAGNPHSEELNRHAANASYFLELIPSTDEMPVLMAWADLAITAGGSTCWELCCVGVPQLILILAKNQEPIATALGQHGQMNLGWFNRFNETHFVDNVRQILEDAEQRYTMSAAAAALVDGLGASRVVCHLRAVGLRLRPVAADDSERFWHWRNDPAVREVSFTSDPIPLEQHQAWFKEKLEDRNTHFFVGIDATDRPAGQVRLDCDGEAAEISVVVAPEFRSRGYGTVLLDLVLSAAFRELGIVSVKALIKSGNEPSIGSFQKLGFHRIRQREINGSLAVEYELQKKAYCGGTAE